VPLADLDDKEREVVRECLWAAAEGPFFPDWEFHTLFGLERDEVRRIVFSWPALDENEESVVFAINNSMNNLLGYPLGEAEEAWPSFISVNREGLASIFDKWTRKPQHGPSSPHDYFDRMS
jgi:hypothetical protein